MTEPAAPNGPIEPTALTEPAAPNGPIEPTALTEPAAPNGPIEPTALTEPAAPNGPNRLIEPTAFTESSAPTEVTAPAMRAEYDGPEAALVHLVDLPWVGAEVIARVAGYASGEVVARAAFGGVPGHPVLFGRRWWPEVAGAARGDRGARDWLANRTDLRLIECGDLGSGRDVDRRADLPG
ncbi:NTP transferase domain-containing protein [Amycolatopsis sp. PS_44_ISF1]|uniref:nucleotidyltransferase family protein n=1 Tax=Amycolatopsis sp. PS_44_ISF1 TaxID=2974917 RepID=UPI0037BFF90A